MEGAARACFRIYFALVHRVRIEGIENVPAHPGKLIIVSNHASLFDGPLLWTCLPLRFKTLIRRDIAQLPVLRSILTDDYVVQVETLNSYSLKKIVALVNDGIPLLVFPEGHRTRTGTLMKIYEGAGFLAAKTGAVILPVYIKNNERILTARTPGRRRWFAPLTVYIGRPQPPFALGGLPPRARRKEAASRIYGLLTGMRFHALMKKVTLAEAVIRLCRRHRRRPALRDVTQRTWSYGALLAGAFALGRTCARLPDRTVGILLPNLSATVLLFLGLQLFHKVPAFLNYAVGAAALRHMMELAGLHVIITSREFLQRLNLGEDVFAGRQLVFIEDLRDGLAAAAKLRAWWHARFPGRAYRAAPGEDRDTAVILFTSGSEGMPKGVPLSHENIITNIAQCLARIDVRENDYLFSALPVFHSFGLTVGVLMPLFAGARIFLYVSPLHYRVVPETVYREACTIMISTNVFLAGYARKAHPYDLHTLRYVYCGAEALRGSVFETYARTFGIRVMSGYGATECAPVISMNNAIEYEYGTVGKILPGIDWKIVPVPGLEGGRLLVRGGNVMAGYLAPAGRPQPVDAERWYDTGDIVEVTGAGFLRIVGRHKRFAKVSGEMVSLAAVEDALAGAFGRRIETAVVAVPDAVRGERIVLAADNPAVTLTAARRLLRAAGIAEIAHPREIRYLPHIPKLGTGKVDYMQLAALVRAPGEHPVPAGT
jgi:acyl-[acyl-carrier-protein]-phospholipid O-acyltransferase/long-chain-fatty-acid--[acyl-carrier-protein] ligase